MNVFTFVLIFICVSSFLSLVFLNFRAKTTKKQLTAKEKKIHFRRKILTIFTFHLLFLFCGFTFGLFFFFSLVGNSITASTNEFYFLIIFFLTVILISYGSGSYLTAVISEPYVNQATKKDRKNIILFLYNEYFHGPFSHVLTFTGINFCLLIFAGAETLNNDFLVSISDQTYYLIAFGVVFGWVYHYWQVKNLTWKHQLPWFLLLFFGHIILIYTKKINLVDYPLNLFIFTFEISLNSFLLIRYVYYKKRKLFYRYNLKFDQLFK